MQQRKSPYVFFIKQLGNHKHLYNLKEYISHTEESFRSGIEYTWQTINKRNNLKGRIKSNWDFR